MPHVTVMESPPVRTFPTYGLERPFLRVFEGLLDVASPLPDYRLSELFAGFSRVDYEDPVPYRVACSPLRVGDARVDLLFERVAQNRDSVALTDVRVDGLVGRESSRIV